MSQAAEQTPARAPAGRGSVAAGLAAAALLAWLYAPTAAELVQEWWRDPNYSHGFLIPPVAAWLVGRQWDGLKRLAGDANPWGLAFVALGLLVMTAGALVHSLFLRGVSLTPVLWGLALMVWGWPLAKKLIFPLCYLWLMVPWPYALYNAVAVPLRQTAAQLAGWALHVIGFPVLVQGNVIHMPTVVLGVVDACSGVRSLVSILAVGMLLAALGLSRWWARVVLLALVVPVVVLTNSVRVTLAGVLAEVVDPATLKGATHDMVGWVVFMAAFVIMLGFTALLRRLGGVKAAGKDV